MNTKSGVVLTPTALMFDGLVMADEVFKRFGLRGMITSGNDSKHKPESAHYRNEAIDLRLPTRVALTEPWDKATHALDYLIDKALRDTLGEAFFVELEEHQSSPWDWHIHIQVRKA